MGQFRVLRNVLEVFPSTSKFVRGTASFRPRDYHAIKAEKIFFKRRLSSYMSPKSIGFQKN